MSSKVRKISKELRKRKTLEVSNPIADKVHVIGRCRCGQPLFHFKSDRKDTVFNVYCNGCKSISDIRFPKPGDDFLIKKDLKPIDLVADVQGVFENKDDFYKYAETAPISKYVTKEHGDLMANDSVSDQIERAVKRIGNGQSE